MKALRVRLPGPVFNALKEMAERTGLSMNKIVEESIEKAAQAERKERLKREFDRIAQLSVELGEVEFACAAQKEVTLAQD